jgi:hypothetical protein
MAPTHSKEDDTTGDRRQNKKDDTASPERNEGRSAVVLEGDPSALQNQRTAKDDTRAQQQAGG